MTNFAKLGPIPLPLNISSTTERRTYKQRNSADGKIFLSYREDIAVLNYFYRTLLKIAKSNYKKDSPKTTQKADCLLFLAQLSLLFQGELLKRFPEPLPFI
ncbi:TPA: hypothetical protein ACHU45_000919 [Streptococcus suis]|uniref:hypothetical protein n=1 Tax=Streptococcus suis TaxID=1307 RepID=UPI001554CF7F|nr:hypothetical protein [Streptococcus suis]NQJ89473.1 hypothetical protein [Streptococcus suis]NQK17526.1 hypothetical protein [Streptococcus suis]NQP14203.1 hypothetical protein [Streptococcus suis]HEM5121703.1 hypothetical protein [Streptococcus suis]HEM5192253.1 hypothetical protein [Streptococcus suis]